MQLQRRYRKFASFTAVAALAGLLTPAPQPAGYGGSFLSLAAQENRVGPLRVAENRRYLVDRNGSPFFWLGDTPWSLFTQYSRSDVVTYLSDRSQKGFTVVQAVVCWSVIQDGGDTCAANTQGRRPFLNNDPRTPDEEFFQNVDWVIDQAAERGMIVALFPVWGHDFVWKRPMINEANAKQYGQFLGARYANRDNIVWVLGGDTAIYDKGLVHVLLGNGVRDFDTGGKLMTYHPSADPDASLGGVTTDPRFNPFGAKESILDFHMAQSWTWSVDLPRLCRMLYNSDPVKPGVLAEGIYEAGEGYPTGPVTPELVRKEAWWSYLSGATGYTYGHFAIWRHDDERWQQTLNDPAARSMAVARRVLSSRRWWRLVPDQSVLAAGERGGHELNVAARSEDGDRLLVYFSAPGSAAINVGAITASDRYSALWIRPDTGEEVPAGDHGTGGFHAYETPQGWTDAVLVLEAWTEPQRLSAEPASGRFIRGVNLAGPSVTIDGQRWLGHAEALNDGLFIEEGLTGEGSVGDALRPAADADTALMLSSTVWRPETRDGEGVRVAQALPNGTYMIYLWMVESYRSYHRSLSVQVQGNNAASQAGRLQYGAWARYGPFPAQVEDGLLRVAVLRDGRGDPCIMGLAIYTPSADQS